MPFLMSYSGSAFDLFAEESSVLMKCLKNTVQYQPSPADETNEAKAARHSQMDTEVKAAQKKQKEQEMQQQKEKPGPT